MIKLNGDSVFHRLALARLRVSSTFWDFFLHLLPFFFSFQLTPLRIALCGCIWPHHLITCAQIMNAALNSTEIKPSTLSLFFFCFSHFVYSTFNEFLDYFFPRNKWGGDFYLGRNFGQMWNNLRNSFAAVSVIIKIVKKKMFQAYQFQSSLL